MELTEDINCTVASTLFIEVWLKKKKSAQYLRQRYYVHNANERHPEFLKSGPLASHVFPCHVLE